MMLTKLYMSVWNKCDLRCRHCFNRGGRRAETSLTSDEVVRIVTGAQRTLGIREAQLTGGEPLLRPDLLPLVERLLTLGITVAVQTGSGVQDGPSHEIESLPAESVTFVTSLDGFASHEYLRGRGSLARSLSFMERVAAKFRLRINAVLTNRLSWHEIEEIVRTAKDLGASLALNPICPMTPAARELLLPRRTYFDWMQALDELDCGVDIRKNFSVRKGELVANHRCPVRLGEALFVDADGTAFPCGFMTPIDNVSLGNAVREPVAALMARVPEDCVTLPEECSSCKLLLEGRCFGGCPARSYGLAGTFVAPDYYCLRAWLDS